MGGSVAYVGVLPGSFGAVPMARWGLDSVACSGCQSRCGCASVRNRSTICGWCSSNAGRSDLTRGSEVKLYGDSAVLHDECFGEAAAGTMHGRERSRDHRRRCNSGHLNPLRHVRTGRERPGCAGLV